MEFRTCFNLGDILEIVQQPTSGTKCDPSLPLLGRIVDIVVRYVTPYDYDIYYSVNINNGERIELAADPEYCDLDRNCDQKECEKLNQIYKVIRHYIPYDADYIGTDFRADAGVINRNAPICATSGGKAGVEISNLRRS